MNAREKKRKEIKAQREECSANQLDLFGESRGRIAV